MPLYIEYLPDGRKMFIHGDLGPHCVGERCGAAGGFLCDFPVADGRTCDRPLCERHAHLIGPDLHYCAAHMVMWRDFRDSGGVERELANVVPFKVKA
jgi:hypothetical protein